MLTTSTVVLVMCVAVCVLGDVFSGNTDQKRMEATIQNTNAVLDQVLKELRYLRDEDQKKTDEINNLKVEDIKNRDENKKNRDEIDNLKGQTAVVSSAFTAVLDIGYLWPEAGDVIPFNTVWLNLGQHYDDQTSVFTCAESGLYLFSVTLYSHDISPGIDYYRLSAALMIDGVNVAEIYSQNPDPENPQEHQSAVTAVVECPKGGSVWVECQYGESQIWGSATSPRSVFTGFAITYNIHP